MIRVRNFKHSDLTKCVNLIKRTWDLTEGCENVLNDNTIYRLYVKECIVNCNYKKVVECDNDIIAVLFVKCLTPKVNHIIDLFVVSLNLLHNLYEIVKKTYGKRTSATKTIIKQYILNILGEKGVYSKYTHEITLFVVDEKYQNRGIGTKLLSDCIDLMLTNRSYALYVWTTSDCNYIFYKIHGFTLISKNNISRLWHSGKPYYLLKYCYSPHNL